MSGDADADTVQRIARLCGERGLSVATAESLTGGQIATALAAGPDSAGWFAGGVVAYSRQVKRRLLGVPLGPVVTAECAARMAQGAQQATGADVVVAVTGVGGPAEEEGHPPGTVWLGACGAHGSVRTEHRHMAGSPEDVLAQTRTRALQMLLDQLGQSAD